MNRKVILISSLICLACAGSDTLNSQRNTVFKRLLATETGLTFQNSVEPYEDFDVFQYRNFYNGGGVAIADFDGDGLSDVYLTANMSGNKLYRNLGNWKFQDMTENAGVSSSKKWSTGVSIADVNADGLLDIYVCNAGDMKGGHRENELFINNGNFTFTERAVEFGLNDNGYSTHAVFFDYDQDGDLDCYVLNNSYKPVSSLGYKNLRNIRDVEGGHRLYRNNNKKFVDVSEQAGIYGSVIGFGLGACVGDVNNDGWPDIYASNDLYERDYLYINNQRGGFDEKLEEYMGHISMFSMGGDMADLNNDGFPEIFSTDMLPEQDSRLKTLIAFETYDVYQLRLQNGYYHQYLRNMLHFNNGGAGFLEVSELAGVSATDWSWGSLIADFNNDGYKEIFVSNGIYKDIMDQDFVEDLGRDEKVKKLAMEGKKIDFRPFLEEMPSIPLSNYLYENKSKWQYENHSIAYGLDEPSFSNGAAYGDLDNDGDLDLIVNNVNQELFVYQNQTSQQGANHFLGLELKGNSENKFSVGATVKIFTKRETITVHQMPNRGFQSSMDYKMIVGLGNKSNVDSLTVEWPDQKAQVLTNVAINQTLKIDYADAKLKVKKVNTEAQPFLKLVNNEDIVHHENVYNEFDRDRLQYQMLSTQGPAFAYADLNNDGQDDVFIGGSAGSTSKIFLQQGNAVFKQFPIKVFESDSLTEDTGAAFFDADNDGDLDLYVATGSVEYSGQSIQLKDRLYINNGSKREPRFEKQSVFDLALSGSCVRPADFDKDGDLDLFVGTRVIPGKYGQPCDQVLLQNNGKGEFTNITSQWAPDLQSFGMVTDAVWTDIDDDGLFDLIVVGEWMPVTLFRNSGSQLHKQTNVPGLAKTDGWWNAIHAADVDGDGDADFVLGNNGRNSRFKPTPDSPLLLYVNDFDQNGSSEPVFAFTENGNEYPLALRQDIVRQMSSMRKRFELYKDYADKTLPEIFGSEMLKKSVQLKYYEPNTAILINNGPSGFKLGPLPLEAQLAPVYGIASVDINNDGHLDLILGGNLFSVKPEVGRYDALHGIVLLGNGKGEFKPLTKQESGLDLHGEVRHIAVLNGSEKKRIVFIRNNAPAVFYTMNK